MAKSAYVVESSIARDDDGLFIPGAWVLGVKVPDDGDQSSSTTQGPSGRPALRWM
jgi:hypothetical protein